LGPEERVTLLNLHNQVIGGRFKLLRRITCGSYSEVYIAANLSPKNDEPPTVVVKVLNQGLRGQLESELERTLLENFQLEAASLRRLQHRHIVRSYEDGRSVDDARARELYYIVLEHLAGGDLYSLCRTAPLPLERSVIYVGHLCSALSCVHEHAIVHRDIKPNNCLLSENHSIVKLLDFGTAHLLDAQNGSITRVGTDVYGAPESYSPPKDGVITPAADVYSLAKVLLFMLTGNSPAHLAQKQITSLPAELVRKPWAQSLLSVLSKATCEEACDRYQTVEEFHRALKQVLELTEVSTATSEARQREWRQYHPPPKHTRFEVPVRNGSVGAAALPLNSLAGGRFVDAIVGAGREAFNGIPTPLVMQIVGVVVVVAIILIGLPQVLPLFRHATAPGGFHRKDQ